MRNILAILLLTLFITACGTTATQQGTTVADTENEETENLLTNEVEIIGGDDEDSSLLTEEADAVETQETDANTESQAAATENFSTDEVGIPDGDVAVTPTLEQTPVGVTLPNAVTSADGSLTVSYPEGWFGQSQSGNTVIVSNDEVLASNSDLQAVSSGQALMLVGTIPRDQLEESNMGLNEMAQQIGESLSASFEASGATFGEPAEGEINGLPSVTLTGSITVEEQPSDIHIVLIDQQGDEVIVQLVLITASGESEQFEGTAQEVAGSAQIEAAPGTEEMDAGEGAAGGTAEISADNLEEAENAEITPSPDAGDGTPDAEGDETEEAGS